MGGPRTWRFLPREKVLVETKKAGWKRREPSLSQWVEHVQKSECRTAVSEAALRRITKTGDSGLFPFTSGKTRSSDQRFNRALRSGGNVRALEAVSSETVPRIQCSSQAMQQSCKDPNVCQRRVCLKHVWRSRTIVWSRNAVPGEGLAGSVIWAQQRLR